MAADFIDIIKTVAPWIGTALAGPLGGMALDAATSALGLSTKTTDALKTAISGATPEQMLALKQADIDFQEHMQQMGYDHIEKLEALANDDRKSARDMEVALRSGIPAFLATAITIGFFGILIGMMSGKLSTDANQALLLMLGSLGTAWTGVVMYYFGSSAGSARKDELAAGAPPKK